MQNIPEDFVIISKGKSASVSFHMMAITCRLFSQKQFPEKQYETYVPVSEEVLKAFVSCVYGLVLDPDSVKTKITLDNIHYLSLMAEEFQCAPLSREIDAFIKHQKHIEVERAESDVTKLEEAIRNQEHEIVSHFERLLASNFANALKVLGRVPSTRIPISCVYRIIEQALQENPEGVNESVLCDFVLAKLTEGDGNDACVLVQFLHLDKLQWGQVKELMASKKVRDWYDEKFPVRFLDELMTRRDARMSDVEREMSGRFERLEAALMERVKGLECENERLRDGIRELAEKKTNEQRMSPTEEMADVDKRINSATEGMGGKLEQRISQCEQDIRDLKKGCVKCYQCTRTDGMDCDIICEECGLTFVGAYVPPPGL